MARGRGPPGRLAPTALGRPPAPPPLAAAVPAPAAHARPGLRGVPRPGGGRPEAWSPTGSPPRFLARVFGTRRFGPHPECLCCCPVSIVGWTDKAISSSPPAAPPAGIICDFGEHLESGARSAASVPTLQSACDGCGQLGGRGSGHERVCEQNPGFWPQACAGALALGCGQPPSRVAGPRALRTALYYGNLPCGFPILSSLEEASSLLLPRHKTGVTCRMNLVFLGPSPGLGEEA